MRRLCVCANWKTFSHPWYLDYKRDNVRYRDNLDKMTGRQAADFNEAKDERAALRRVLLDWNPRD